MPNRRVRSNITPNKFFDGFIVHSASCLLGCLDWIGADCRVMDCCCQPLISRRMIGGQWGGERGGNGRKTNAGGAYGGLRAGGYGSRGADENGLNAILGTINHHNPTISHQNLPNQPSKMEARGKQQADWGLIGKRQYDWQTYVY